ncbi:hypothetical protein PIB30_104364, partial [Stylosanthes scabra]|nr:hypothetical protein [Stylosanthes scabra]
MWEVPSKFNPKEMTHVELILQDSKVLTKFKLFNMRSFIVIEKSMRSRTTRTNLVLTFSNRTIVTRVLNPTFPLEALRLREIGHILCTDGINEAAIFLCGSIGRRKEGPRDMLTKTGKELKRLAIIVEDLK